MIESVRLPWAIGPPNGLSAFARSMSTWIHWWSPDTSANVLIMSCVISRHSLGPICRPTISFRPSIPSTVIGAMPGGYPAARASGGRHSGGGDDLAHDLECPLDARAVHVEVCDCPQPRVVEARDLHAGGA